MLARARELERGGADIVHFEIGEPDLATPPHVVEAAVAAMRRGETRYTEAGGIPELREAAAAYLTATRGTAFDPARVLIGTGAKPFVFFSILALCGPGDEVVYPDPGFPTFEAAIGFAGATPVPLPLRPERSFRFDAADLEARLGPRTKLVILNSPHNPTGSVAPAAELAAAAELIVRTNAYVLSDEVYSHYVHTGVFNTIAAQPGLSARTIVIDSCSKTFGMTGWRCGFAACPAELVRPLVDYFAHSTTCVPPFVQAAAVAALSSPPPAAITSGLAARRQAMVDALTRIPGVDCPPPDGAIYVFPGVGGLPLSAEDLALRLLEDAGVAVLPGSMFGRNGARHLRLSYALPEAELERGLERIARFVASI